MFSPLPPLAPRRPSLRRPHARAFSATLIVTVAAVFYVPPAPADFRFDWTVVAVDSSSASSGSSGGGGSTAGTSSSSSRRRARRMERRRRLSTTSGGYSEGGGEDSEYDEGDDEGNDEGDDEGDGEVEFSEFSGEFLEADEACESVGFVFGAPRTAYENAILRIRMEVSHRTDRQAGRQV